MTDDTKITPEQMKMIDSLYASPSDRATAVFNLLLGELSEDASSGQLGLAFWDVFCFAVEFLGMAAQGFGAPGLIRVAKAANYWLYTSHYNDIADILPAPDLLTWRVKYGIQQEPGSGEEDGAVPEGDDPESDDNVISLDNARKTRPPPPGSN